jgi:hypothetical protein
MGYMGSIASEQSKQDEDDKKQDSDLPRLRPDERQSLMDHSEFLSFSKRSINWRSSESSSAETDRSSMR